MPIAAVPHYLGSEFKTASPGMRFGMYFKGWETGVSGGDLSLGTDKRSAIRAACALEVGDKAAMAAWRERQHRQAEPLLHSGRLLQLTAICVSPFATGLGREHPTENGFAFLWPYGLPYLPGSGVKGVLRASARELDWPDEDRIALFGSDPPAGDEDLTARRAALEFWDVLPQLAQLRVDVMTAHQGHYHLPRDTPDPKAGGSSSPHDSGQPNPIYFLTVPPGAEFSFHVACAPERLPEHLAKDGRWRERLTRAFEHAFAWLGFGAKTAVGYGAMRRDRDAEQRAQQAADKRRAEHEKQAMPPGLRAVREFEEQMQSRANALRGRKTPVGQEEYQRAQALSNAARSGGWSAEERAAAADAIEHWGPRLIAIDPKDLRKKLGLAALRAPG